jgi:hypothetical protein
MRDLDKALADIASIRHQIAAGTVFQGYGPLTLSLTGGLALVTATAQSLWLGDPKDAPLVFLAGWIATALVATGLVGSEMLARSRRHHSGLANELIFSAVERFMPASAAGALLALVICRFAPEATWMLPGLWQILVGVGLFASVHVLPKAVVYGAAWYLVAGLVALMIAADNGRVLSPWTMGLPFAVGQVLLAAILHLASEDAHGDA